MSERLLATNWDNQVIYQIYPSTFNEDEQREPTGIGSIRGIIEKLDYIEELGVGTIWVSPFFQSPMEDGGYDISDATAVNPNFGRLEDFEELIEQAHQRGIKVVIDLIPNHTSDQHAWFRQSQQSRDTPKSDWYIWRDGRLDAAGQRQPPNNWASVFSLPQLEARQNGAMPELEPSENTPPLSAWAWSEPRQQYYLHSFASSQPDLNWQNPEVRRAIKDVMRFWLDRGVDGFRVDAVNYIGKNPDLPDEEADTSYREGEGMNPYDQLIRHNSTGYLPTMVPYIREMVAVLDEPQYVDRDLRLIFEAYMEGHDLRMIDQLAPSRASSFNFERLDHISSPAIIHKLLLDSYYDNLPDGSIANQVTGNHDKPRLASVLGAEAARSMLLFNMMLPGQTFVYNGEELGLTDHQSIPRAVIKDPNGLRDPSRTPMVWDDRQTNAGFSTVAGSQLYLPINPADLSKSVRQQTSNPQSDLSLFKAATKLKRLIAADRYHKRNVISHDSNGLSFDVVAFETSGRNRAMTIRNFSEKEQHVMTNTQYKLGSLALSSCSVEDRSRVGQVVLSDIVLQPHETVVFTDLK